MEKAMRSANSVFCLLVSFLLFGGRSLIAKEQDSPLEQQLLVGENRTSNPYCGISCLYAVMKLHGYDIDYRELLKGEYIGSRRGSTIAELKKASQDAGLFAYAITNLTVNDLRRLRCPVILHVKRFLADSKYHHYVLFLGTENDRVRIVDPPYMGYVGIDELLPRWSGTGLLISTRPINRLQMFSISQKRFLLGAIACVGVILAVRKGWRYSGVLREGDSGLRGQLVQCIIIGGLTLLFGVCYHCVACDSLLANPGIISALEKAHAGLFIRRIGYDKVRRSTSNGAVLVDARYARDYEAGHIDKAISIPVDANDAVREGALLGLSKQTPLIVYCQSAGCKFAERVALKIQADGFANICIYRGGWTDWSARHNSMSMEQNTGRFKDSAKSG